MSENFTDLNSPLANVGVYFLACVRTCTYIAMPKKKGDDKERAGKGFIDPVTAERVLLLLIL